MDQEKYYMYMTDELRNTRLNHLRHVRTTTITCLANSRYIIANSINMFPNEH